MKQITLTELKLHNFRNIADNGYHFAERTAISGHNFIGKSNTINAIAWLLTDKLMSGSSDSASIKPLSDTKQEVIVTATFNVDGADYIVAKSYKERWVTTRGQTEAHLEAHDTVYTINDIKQKSVTAAIADIYNRFGIPLPSVGSKFDLMRAMTNPLYYEQIPWQELFQFISTLVAPVKDEDVYAKEPLALGAQKLLIKYGGKTGEAMQYAKQQATSARETKANLEIIIKSEEALPMVDEQKLKAAQTSIAEINAKITEINTGANVEDPAIGEKEKEIEQLSNRILEERSKSKQANMDANASIYATVNQLRKRATDAFTAKGYAVNDKQTKSNQIAMLEKDIENWKEKLTTKQGERANLIAQWKVIKARVFNAPAESKCPQCAYLLNQSEIDTAKETFDKTQAFDLEDNVARGKAVKLVIDDLNLKINQANDRKAVLDREVDLMVDDIADKSSKYERLNAQIEEENAKVKTYAVPDYISALEVDLTTLKGQLLTLRAPKADSVDKFSITSALRASKAPYQAIVDEHTHWLATQREIKDNKEKLKLAIRDLNTHEDEVMAIEKYLEAKLSLLNANIKAVFGEVEFVLAEPNIKEGSWNQVCYPLIVGKKVPFEHGSTSEKITTGLAIIESIRTAMSLPNIPITFDEGEALDAETIATRLKTQSQIITARVDDNYTVPTSVDLTSKREVA